MEKQILIHKKNKDLEEMIHGKKYFIPYCQNTRVIEKNSTSPALYENKYFGEMQVGRTLEKDKWIDPEHDFRRATKVKRKLY